MRTCRWLAALTFLSWPVWAAAEAGKPEVKKELAKFQGTWQVVSLQVDGKSPPPEMVQSMTLVLKGNHFIFKAGDKVVGSGTFKVDPSKKALDRTDQEGDDKGKTFHGIYEIDGDTLKSCWAAAGKDRPTKFASTEGSGEELEVLKRIHP